MRKAQRQLLERRGNCARVTEEPEDSVSCKEKLRLGKGRILRIRREIGRRGPLNQNGAGIWLFGCPRVPVMTGTSTLEPRNFLGNSVNPGGFCCFFNVNFCCILAFVFDITDD
jgi:hypothetical protein